MSLKGSTNAEKIWNFLIGKGLTPHGVAGLMGNLQAESALEPTNLQNEYNTRLKMTDAAYTAAVDAGTYTNFVKDAAGYGLAQWTYWSRKEALLSYAKACKVSIGDLEMQLGFLYKELSEGYTSVLSTLKKASAILEASNIVLAKFENPADQSADVQKKRAEFGQTFFDKYAAQSGTEKEDNAMSFTMRTTKPGAGNKYYIRKASGGYSDAIKGSPTDSECDVLANCVGYAYGRFNEIGGWGSCKYLSPVNAENFIQYKGSLEVSQTPQLGACMVWQKGATLSGSDGAGHVAIVEKVVSDTEVYTSESGYGSKAFWNQTRKKGDDGNWGQSSGYKFLGFILNPAPCCKGSGGSSVNPGSSAGLPSGSTSLKFAVGDIVNFAGGNHYASAGASSGPSVKASKAKVTAVSVGNKHPYHLRAVNDAGAFISGGVYGWVDESTVSAIATTGTSSGNTSGALKVGDIVNFTGTKHYTSADATVGPACKPGKAKITKIYNLGKSKHPYHVVAVSGGGSNVYGWVDAADIEGAAAADASWTPKVGDVVNFNGSVHYANANAVTGPACKPGQAKITQIYLPDKSKHPYHLKATDGSSSTVYGWVDAGTFTKA